MSVNYQQTKQDLINYLVKEYIEVSIKNIDRFKISYDDNSLIEKSKEWCKNSKVIKCIRLTFDISIYLITFNEDYYLLTQNFQYTEVKGLINYEDFNLGMLLLLFEKEKFYLKVDKQFTSREVEDRIDIIDEEYTNHDFDEIKRFFGKVYVYKILDDCPLSFEDEHLEESVDRILSLILIENYKNNSNIFFSTDTLEKYKQVILEDSVYFPYNNILMSLMQNNEKTIFLELYKVIEKLYPYTFMHLLKSTINEQLKDTATINFDLFKLQKAVSKISWKHKEEDAINKIFDDLNLEENEKIRLITVSDITKLGTWVYRIRNTIVHLSFIKDDKNMDIQAIFKDDNVIEFILPLLHKMYKNYFGK